MAKVNFTPALAEEYQRLYNQCSIKDAEYGIVDRLAEQLLQHRSRYETVGNALGIPWYVIAVIHNMESSQNFSRHLHNGDPLTARTRHYPPNRPAKGTPPFTWEESAVDALKLRKLHQVGAWTIPRALYEIEGYNGWGYRLYHSHVLTPYLWSYSDLYKSGKYVADGTWSDTAKSKQCGAAVLLRRLDEIGAIGLQHAAKEPIFVHGNDFNPQAKSLQQFLNDFEGIALRVDGYAGDNTSDAVKKLFGFYLKNDPRADDA